MEKSPFGFSRGNRTSLSREEDKCLEGRGPESEMGNLEVNWLWEEGVWLTNLCS